MFGGMGLSVLKYISCPHLYFGFSQLSLDFDAAITFCFAGITFSLDSFGCFSLMLRNTISCIKFYSLFPWTRQQMLQTALFVVSCTLICCSYSCSLFFIFVLKSELNNVSPGHILISCCFYLVSEYPVQLSIYLWCSPFSESHSCLYVGF